MTNKQALELLNNLLTMHKTLFDEILDAGGNNGDFYGENDLELNLNVIHNELHDELQKQIFITEDLPDYAKADLGTEFDKKLNRFLSNIVVKAEDLPENNPIRVAVTKYCAGIMKAFPENPVIQDMLVGFVPVEPEEINAQEVPTEPQNAPQIVQEAEVDEEAALKNMIDRMINDKEYCKSQIKSAHEGLKKLCDPDNNEGRALGDIIAEKNSYLLNLLIGERILYEHDCNDVYRDDGYSKSMRDFFIPSPLFRKPEDLVHGATYTKDGKLYEYNSQEISHDRAIKDLISKYQDIIDEYRQFSPEYKKDDIASLTSDIAEQYNEKFAENKLRKPDGKATLALKNIRGVGSTDTLQLSKDDLKTLGGEGSPEFTNMHNALSAYLTARRVPGKDCAQELYDIVMTASDYLLKKDTVPWSTEGKKRVAAATHLLEQAGLRFLENPDGISRSEVDRDACTYDVRAALSNEMLRNPTLRGSIIDRALSGKKPDEKVAKFALTAETYARENPQIVSGGRFVKGKVLDANGASVNNAVQSLDGFTAFCRANSENKNIDYEVKEFRRKFPQNQPKVEEHKVIKDTGIGGPVK